MVTSHITALNLSQPELSAETQAYFDKCREKLGLVPNVLRAYAFDETKLRAFTEMYNDLMLGDSGLSKLEREMIAVVVSSINHCFYCLAAHGAAVRQLSGDPAEFGKTFNVGDWRQRPGFTDRDIWDIASVVTAFFNMSTASPRYAA